MGYIRKAVLIGGDSDTRAAIAGSLAEGSYGSIPAAVKVAMAYLPPEMKKIMDQFYDRAR